MRVFLVRWRWMGCGERWDHRNLNLFYRISSYLVTLLHLVLVMISLEAVLERRPFSMYTQQVSLTMRLTLMAGLCLLEFSGMSKWVYAGIECYL